MLITAGLAGIAGVFVGRAVLEVVKGLIPVAVKGVGRAAAELADMASVLPKLITPGRPVPVTNAGMLANRMMTGFPVVPNRAADVLKELGERALATASKVRVPTFSSQSSDKGVEPISSDAVTGTIHFDKKPR